jgi:hypothetical protein
MKHTVKFSFPKAGTYRALLTGIQIGTSKWSQSLQYVFSFNLISQVVNGMWEDLDEPISYERAIGSTRDNESLFNLLHEIGWPIGDSRDFTFETDELRNFIIPMEVPRLFEITFVKGLGNKAAMFKSICPHEES